MSSTTPPTPLPEPQPGLPMISCAEAKRLSAYLIEDGELKETERSILFTHINQCLECKNELDRHRQLAARLRSTFASLDTSPDFTQDVLDALPPEELIEAPAWLGGSKRFPNEPLLADRSWRRHLARPGVIAFLRAVERHRLPLGLAAVVILGTAIAWIRLGQLRAQPPAPPSLLAVSGEGVVLRGEKELPLGANTALCSGDRIEARSASALADSFLTLKIGEGNQPQATLTLRPGSRLTVIHRGRFQLNLGEAHFLVLPGQRAQERDYFTVETAFGRVQVLGTEFAVLAPSYQQPNQATVLLQQGSLELVPNGGDPIRLEAGQEADLLNTGLVSPRRELNSARLAWLRDPTPPRLIVTERATGQLLESAQPAHRKAWADWSTPVSLECKGRLLADCLESLSEDLAGLPTLRQLAEKARLSRRSGRPIHLTLRKPLALEAVVRWLARESGWRFQTEPLELRPAETGEALGDRAAGTYPPPEDFPFEDEQVPDLDFPAYRSEKVLGRYCEFLAETAHENILLEPSARTIPLPPQFLHTPGRTSFLASLDRALASCGLERAYYDGLWYVATPELINELTTIHRSRSVEPWIGEPPHPAWVQALKSVFSGLRLDRQGQYLLGSEGRPLLERVQILESRKELHYTGGLVTQKRLEEVLALLQGSAPAVPAEAALNEIPLTGSFGSARKVLEALDSSAGGTAGLTLASQLGQDRSGILLRARGLPGGEALFWAARLQGLGVRVEGGQLCLDDWARCYGPPLLKAVRLNELVRAWPQGRRRCPEALGRVLQALYPLLFEGVTFHPVDGALLFHGDTKQLGIAQALVTEWAAQLAERAPDTDFDPLAWRPLSRLALEAQLQKPFSGLPEASVAAMTFGEALAAAFPQLRATLVADARLLAGKGSRRLAAFKVEGRSVGEVLQALCEQAAAKLTLEGEVIVIRD